MPVRVGEDLEYQPDEALVARYRAGEARAAEELIRRYRGFVRMKSAGYYLRGADRDDLVQEGLIGVYKAIRDFDLDRGIPFRAFADVCVTRQMMTAVKAASRYKHTPLNAYISISPVGANDGSEPAFEARQSMVADPAELLVGRQDLQAIHVAFAALLSRFEADVLHLYLEGVSYREISRRLARGVKAVDNAVQRIRRKVGAHLRSRQEGLARDEPRVVHVDLTGMSPASP